MKLPKLLIVAMFCAPPIALCAPPIVFRAPAIVFCAPPIVFRAPPTMAQQPAQPSGPPPYTASPASPRGQVPGQAMPPDTKAPAETLSTAQVRQQIDEKLKTEPELGHVSVHAKVNGRAIVLKGNVENERQHDLALRIAQSYAGGRQILDHLKVRQPSL